MTNENRDPDNRPEGGGRPNLSEEEQKDAANSGQDAAREQTPASEASGEPARERREATKDE